MEVRLNGETQHKMVLSLQEEQSELNRQLTQLRLNVQEKDSCIQCVNLSVFSCAYIRCPEKRCHFIFDYNSRISWSIFILLEPLETGMNNP